MKINVEKIYQFQTGDKSVYCNEIETIDLLEQLLMDLNEDDVIYAIQNILPNYKKGKI